MTSNSNNGITTAPTDSNFWQSYFNLAVKSGVNVTIARWYTNWIKQLSQYLKKIPLTKCSESDAKNFLANLSLKKNIKPWQIEQARSALFLLYDAHCKTTWASQIKEFSIKDQVAKLKAESSLRENRKNPSVFKDASLSGDNLIVHQDLFDKLRTEIRVRHYSIRTEKVYEQWVSRFLHFHKGKSANRFSGNDVKVYLDYLATKREVAASTQNQALNALVFLFKPRNCWDMPMSQQL